MNDQRHDVQLSRRAMLASAGLAAAGWMMQREVLAADNPAANVEDRGSNIKITGLKPYPIGGSRVLIKIETNQKIFGWGEISQLVPKAAIALVESIYDLLDGENPTRIEYLWQKLFRAHRDFRGGAFMVHTIAAIDMALWDIAGKLYGVPVYRLLGGPSRDKVRVYPTAKAIKIGVLPQPYSSNPNTIEELVNRVKEARKQVGPDGTVMFDAHSAIPVPTLIQFANSIAPSDVLWIEEPAVPGNIEVFKRLKQQIKIPIATGERDRTIWDVIPYLQNNCVDILQPDVAHGGGISQMKKIAALAEAYNVPLAPHCTTSFLAATASFHVATAIPNFLIHEFYPQNLDGILRKTWEVDKDGYASLSQGPGLGVEVDEVALAKVDPNKKFKWPEHIYPDGSITDY